MEQAAVSIKDLGRFAKSFANIDVEWWKLSQDEGAFEDFDVALDRFVVDSDNFGGFRVVPVLAMVVCNQLQ